MLTELKAADILPVKKQLADSLFRLIPAGVGSESAITLDPAEMEAMLAEGVHWAVARGWGEIGDLERIEEQGRMVGARPDCLSDRAKERQRREMGTLGSGNHYLEVQAVTEIFNTAVADVFGLAQDDVVVTIHCGSRGLGHQIGTEFLKEMVVTRNTSVSIFPTANSPVHRSIRKSASATSAPCARRSIARSPIVRFSATTSAASSGTSFRTMT
jgi:tRNA-splicing ligase RtcB